MENLEKSKPCLVESEQGFCVEYKNRLLYSKYNPKKNISSIIDNFSVLPNTLILCFSPALCYGVDELYKKLPEDCLLVGVEKDEELFDFSKEYCKALESFDKKKFILLKTEELNDFPIRLNEDERFRGKFKRVVKIDFSAGVQFNLDFYNDFFVLCQNSIIQFWKNRVTLVKFGRRFSKNFFINLNEYRKSPSSNIFALYKTICKPILVLGAGEGLESVLNSQFDFSEFFIIAVDAALLALKTKKIKVDAVICDESQILISKAFVGCKNYCDYAFISLSSCPKTASFAAKKTYFYTTLFDSAGFINELKKNNELPECVLPLGSVGLSATYIALHLRASQEIPIFTVGLDFSYIAGKTHARGTNHSVLKLIFQNKIKSISDVSSSFTFGTQKTLDKNKNSLYTLQNMLDYRNLFENLFSTEKNLFDASNTGLNLGLPVRLISTVELIKNHKNNFEVQFFKTKNVSQFEKEQLEILLNLKEILTTGQDTDENIRNEKILSLLKNREYLYLHFPDGYKANLSLSFLKRVRIEINFFIKLFTRLSK